jgi:hypothetical protein
MDIGPARPGPTALDSPISGSANVNLAPDDPDPVDPNRGDPTPVDPAAPGPAALTVLTRRYAFAEIAALLEAGLIERDVVDVADAQQLCAFGQRLLDLDAEDFGQPDAAHEANTDHHIADLVTGNAVPTDLVERSRAARMPQSPNEAERGALGTLRPAFGLMLEAIAIRWLRNDTSALVAAVHTASEYLPLLMWEPVLGHAADPDHMPESVGGAGSRWGEFTDPECPQTKTQKSAAERSLRVAAEPDPGWRAYLDRQHSVVAEALTTCATYCRTPCSVVTRHSAAEQSRLAVAGRLADEFTGSAIVRLRHSSPVGHAFGVPSAGEITEAWNRTRTTLGAREPAMLVDDGFCLTGLPSLFATVAGVPIRPTTIIADTMAALRHTLGYPPVNART